MGVIRTNAAAAMLGVSTNTLRSWERRFGYPEPRRTAGGHRQYDVAQVEALRCAFQETGNVASAVSLARDRGEGPATGFRLRTAFARFDEPAADRVLEESLAVRSIERTVEEVLLPGVEALGAGDGDGLVGRARLRVALGDRVAGSADAGGARRHPCGGRGRLRRQRAVRRRRPARPGARARAAASRRAHAALTVARPTGSDTDRLEPALRAVAPSAVVLTGRRASLDALGRLVFAARRQGGDRVGVFDFRGALPDTGASTVRRLGPRAMGACDALVEHLDGREPARPRRGARVALHAVRGA